jgi:hypothetical protein
MFSYKIYTIHDSTLVWTYNLRNETEVWERLASAKKLPIEELKKIFKIEKIC